MCKGLLAHLIFGVVLALLTFGPALAVEPPVLDAAPDAAFAWTKASGADGTLVHWTANTGSLDYTHSVDAGERARIKFAKLGIKRVGVYRVTASSYTRKHGDITERSEYAMPLMLVVTDLADATPEPNPEPTPEPEPCPPPVPVPGTDELEAVKAALVAALTDAAIAKQQAVDARKQTRVVEVELSKARAEQTRLAGKFQDAEAATKQATGFISRIKQEFAGW